MSGAHQGVGASPAVDSGLLFDHVGFFITWPLTWIGKFVGFLRLLNFACI